MGNNISSDDSDIWKHKIIQQQQNNDATQSESCLEHRIPTESASSLHSTHHQPLPTAYRDTTKTILTTISEKQQLAEQYHTPLLRHTSTTTPTPVPYYDNHDRPISRNRCHSRSSRDNARYTNSSFMGSGFSSTFGGSDSFHFSSVAADSTITDLTNASTFSINSLLDKASDEKNYIIPATAVTAMSPHHINQKLFDDNLNEEARNNHADDVVQQLQRQQSFESFTTAQDFLDHLIKNPESIYDLFTYIFSTKTATQEFKREAFLAIETWSLRPTDSFAKVIAACCRLYGWGTDKDPEWGFRDLQALAKQQGVWEALYYLGQCYHYGVSEPSSTGHIIQPVDKEQAIYCYSKYIENAGKATKAAITAPVTTHNLTPQYAQTYVAEAQFRIVAINFAAGNITMDNLDDFTSLLKQSADSGNRKAEFSMGLMLDSGIISDAEMSPLTFYERSSLKGYAPAQVQLGLKLIRNDSSEGVKWLKKAAQEEDDAWAYYHLGETYEFGRCVHVDKLSAFQNYTTAANVHNNYLAQFRLGFHYLNGGLGLQKDVSKAFQFLSAAAKSGYPDAQYLLGMMFRQGNIPPPSLKNSTVSPTARKLRNEKEAFRWIRRAATQGMHTAITQIANCYEEGIGTAVNHGLAAEYYEIAAKIPGKHLPSAQLTYARFLHKTGHFSKALSLYLLAAGLEHSPLNTVPSSPAISRVAQRMVALLYLDENDTTTPYRPKEALELLFSLASCPEGDAEAHYWLAVCYTEGVPDVLQKDLPKAYDHYLLSANLGSADSLFQVGYMLCKGIGVKEDKTAAFSWFKRSAERNHADALYYLGIYHYNGTKPVLERNHEEARNYFRKAAEANHVEAMVAYAQLCQDKILHLTTKNALSLAGDELKFLQNQVMKWYTRAAKKNNLTGLRELGRNYTLKGDKKKALECYLKAASLNDGLSTLILGGFYENGQGMPVNTQMALKCYAKAYELGQSTALFASAELYEKLQDYKTAYAYYQRILNDQKVPKQLASKKMSKLKVALYSLHYHPNSNTYTRDLASTASTQPQLFESIPSLLTKSEAFQLLLELGQTERFEKAYHWIAKCYYDGYGAPLDRVEAQRWISNTTL